MRLFHDDMNWPHKLKPATADVLALIEKFSFTGNKKGWYGSLRQLAEMCPTDISHTLASTAIKELLELGLIVEPQKGVYFVTKRDTDVTNHDNPVTERDTFVTERDKIAPLNNPPKDNNNNEPKETEPSRTPPRDEVQQFIMEPTFNIFWAAFHPPKNLSYNKPQCRWLWEEILPHSVRQQIINELFALEATGKHTEQRNAYFYLTRFAPKVPHDWNNDYSIDQATSARLICAKFGDHYGSFTPEHVLFFRLEVSPDYQSHWDAYLRYVDSDPNKRPPKYKST